MLAMMSLSDAISRLMAMRPEIINATIETFIMLGISTTVAIVIGGVFGVFLFLSSDRQLLQNKPLYAVLGGFTNFMRAFPFVILMVAMSPVTKNIVGTSMARLRRHWCWRLLDRFILLVWLNKTSEKYQGASLRLPSLWEPARLPSSRCC